MVNQTIAPTVDTWFVNTIHNPMKERITMELRNAMKSQDKLRTSVLRMILADITNKEKSGKEFEYKDVVKGYANKLKKTIEEYERLHVQDRVDAYKAELAIVEEFLPKQMSDEELEKVVTEIIESQKPKDIGSAMKIIMSKYKDVVDGKKVQTLVRNMFLKKNT
ncbi:MAG: GatB/YqeY domain-containing protein [Candidatus Scalinduaceae bacterium]